MGEPRTATAPGRQAPFVQIEITTICNYRCFYCAGRDMPQRHMPMEQFTRILEALGDAAREVSLQGEGEPTAHPQFRDMAEAVRARGLQPYTITNASLIRDPPWFAQVFPVIGVSVDTLDADEGERIGRIRLAHALKGVQALVGTMGASRIVLHTVDYGQPLDALRQWAQAQGFRRHIVQPLQRKPDYVQSYKLPVDVAPDRYHGRCRYLEQPRMDYYTIDGVRLPCCFIKDTRGFESVERLREQLASRQVPACCAGCREILVQPSGARLRATQADALTPSGATPASPTGSA